MQRKEKNIKKKEENKNTAKYEFFLIKLSIGQSLFSF